MIKAGQTILLPTPGHEIVHLWVIVISAQPVTGEVVIANLTSQHAHSDTTVVLESGDHPFVQHPTVVYYADARIVDGNQLARALEAGTFRSHADCEAVTLQRIQEGLFNSPFTPNKVKIFAEKSIEQN